MKPSKKSGSHSVKSPKTSPDIGYSIIVLAYSLVTVLTPNLYTFDSNGPKILMLAIINLVAFCYLWMRKDFRKEQVGLNKFILNPSGMALMVFLIISLLSFSVALNINESILQVTKVFTLFATAYILFLVFRKGEVYFVQMAFVFTMVLLVDSLTVFYNISLFIDGKILTIKDIKSIYSNKNILTAAIFVKIPFALWFSTFYRNWLRSLGKVVLFLALTAIFFMSSRASYLGTFLLMILLIGYLGVRYYQLRSKTYLKQILSFFLILSGSFIIYQFTQTFIYPKSNDLYAENVAQRLGTLTSHGRSMAWSNSLTLIRENPILGVGTGNWKVRELKYENPVQGDFIFMVKAHNDFLEATAETGIPGGIAFLAIFIFPFVYFFRIVLRNAPEEEQKIMFPVAAGLFCYSIDAFLNFPADRPEIQILFASYLAGFIAYSSSSRFKFNIPQGIIPIIRGLFVILLVVAIFIFQKNFISLKIQRIVVEETLTGTLTTSSDIIVNKLPSIPDLNGTGEPVRVIKARYLINEKKYDEAIKLLEGYNGSPYDSRKECYLAMAYGLKGMDDSAIHYTRIAYELKPMNFKPAAILCQYLEMKGQIKQAQEIASSFLKKSPKEKQMWLIAINLCEKSGNLREALAVNDSALKYLPGDTLLYEYRSSLAARVQNSPAVTVPK